jgi:hypothetical protein
LSMCRHFVKTRRISHTTKYKIFKAQGLTLTAVPEHFCLEVLTHA